MAASDPCARARGSGAHDGHSSSGDDDDDLDERDDDAESVDAAAAASAAAPSLALLASFASPPAVPPVARAAAARAVVVVDGHGEGKGELVRSSPAGAAAAAPPALQGQWRKGMGSDLFPPDRVAPARAPLVGLRGGEEGALQLYFVDFDSDGTPPFASVSSQLVHRAALAHILKARLAAGCKPAFPTWLETGSRFRVTQCKQHDGRWQLLVYSSRSEQSLNADLFTAIGYSARAAPPKREHGTLGPVMFADMKAVLAVADSFPTLTLRANFSSIGAEQYRQYRNSFSWSIDAKQREDFHRAVAAVVPRAQLRVDEPRVERAAVCSHCTRFGHLRARCPSLLSLQPGCGRCGISGPRRPTSRSDCAGARPLAWWARPRSWCSASAGSTAASSW